MSTNENDRKPLTSIQTCGENKMSVMFTVESKYSKPNGVTEVTIKNGKTIMIALTQDKQWAEVFQKKGEYIAEPGSFNAVKRNMKYKSASTRPFDLWINCPERIKLCNVSKTSNSNDEHNLGKVLNILGNPARKNLSPIQICSVEFGDWTAHRYWGCTICKSKVRANDCSKCVKKTDKKMYYRISQITLRQGNCEVTRVVCFDQIGQQIIGQEASSFQDDLQASGEFGKKVSAKLFNVQLSGERCQKPYEVFWNVRITSIGTVGGNPIPSSSSASGNGISFQNRENFIDAESRNLYSGDDYQTDPTVPLTDQEKNAFDLRIEGLPKLEVLLNRTGDRTVQTQGPGIYQMKSQPKGFVLILSNTNFPNNKDRFRFGGQCDEEYLLKALPLLGFECHLEQNVNSAEHLDEILANFQSKLDQKDANCSMVFAMSHGLDREFELTNGTRINFWEKVIYKFSVQNCSAMAGKPKLFFVNTCQNFTKSSAAHREYPLEQDITDILVVISALPGFSAHRHKRSGSLFIRTLVEILMKHACDKEIQKILREVQRSMLTLAKKELNRTQMLQYIPLSFDDFYFNIR